MLNFARKTKVAKKFYFCIKDRIAMRISHKLSICLTFLLLSIMMPAQNLTSLKKADNITIGSLRNGVQYYLVTNTSDKGLADFSLIQNGMADGEKSREVFTSTTHFNKKSPSEFLSSKGIGYSSEGYITHYPTATSFDFHDVPVFDNSAVDSTLMLIFDLVDTYDASQAIIIAGDITVNTIKEKMSVLSMTVGNRKKAPATPEYVWAPVDTMTFRFIQTPNSPAGFVSAMYEFPRTPKENMATAQPFVSQMFATEFGTILKNRLNKKFRTRGLPVPSIDYVYSNSSQSPFNEHYTITIHTAGDSLASAVSVLSSTLFELDSLGASYEEYKDAKDQLLANLTEMSHQISNKFYVDKCKSAYLYGSDLAPISTMTNFIKKREMDPNQELTLYNNFVAALLDKKKNLTLQCVGSSFGDEYGDYLKSTFINSWQNETSSRTAYRAIFADTLGLAEPSKKVKIKESISEPVSGGQLITFSNGVKVIYKQATTNKGEFRYALMIRGGYSSVPFLGQGEGAFVSDMLPLYDVGGLQGDDFYRMLNANGISMTPEVSLSDLRIVGSAPSSKLTLLLKSLLSIANQRKTNLNSFSYYKKNENLLEDMMFGKEMGIAASVDSAMYPGYKYTSFKNIKALRDDLPARAEVYFKQQFSRVNDGVIVLIGDLEETSMKKILCKYLGGFKTEGNGFVPRPRIQYQMPSGTVTYIKSLDNLENVFSSSVTVSMASQIPFSTDKYTAFNIACRALQKEVIKNLSATGMYLEMESGYNTFPQETMFLTFTCRPADMYGLPSGMDPADAVVVLENVRTAIKTVTNKAVSATDLSAYKAMEYNYLASSLAYPENMVNAILTRYSEGKDMISKYKERIEGVTAQNVSDILKSLSSGVRVEYVVK